jgi:TonB family protein
MIQPLMLILLAQAAGDPPPVVAPPPVVIAPLVSDLLNGADPRKPRPMDPPYSWITTGDYPAEALSANVQGAVGFTVDVAADGRVTGCRVTAPSGSSVLDAATCSLVSRRARFVPATDTTGKPIEGTFSSRVRWTIPRLTPPASGHALTTFVVEPDGNVTDCKIELTGAAAAQLQRLGNMCDKTTRMSPYLDAKGKPERRAVRIDMTVEVTPAP